MKTREEYKKKIAFCDKLGAKKFQKVVLKAEELKFKVIKKLFPRFIEHYDKYCDRRRDKALKKASTAEEQKRIVNDYRNQKIAMRRELNREQNRNYHMDENKPTEFLYYLNWNKDVHKKGLIRNAVVVSAAIGALILGISPVLATVSLAYELIGAFINFQCINIQNSHIYRYKMLEENLIKREKNRNEKNIANYSHAAKVYARSIEGNMDVPSLEQLIANVKTPEEAAELRKMIQAVAVANNRRKEQMRPQSPKQPFKEAEQTSIESATEPQKTPKDTQGTLRINVDLEIEKMLGEPTNQNEKTNGIQKKIGGIK